LPETQYFFFGLHKKTSTCVAGALLHGPGVHEARGDGPVPAAHGPADHVHRRLGRRLTAPSRQHRRRPQGTVITENLLIA